MAQSIILVNDVPGGRPASLWESPEPLGSLTSSVQFSEAVPIRSIHADGPNLCSQILQRCMGTVHILEKSPEYIIHRELYSLNMVLGNHIYCLSSCDLLS